MSPSTFKAHIQELIAVGQIDEALDQLRQILSGSPLLDEALQQSARFQHIRQQIRLGLVNHTEATLTQNQITSALLELLNELDSPTDSHGLREAFQQALRVSNSKNVVANSHIQAGDDVHIGDKHITQNAEKIYNINHIDNADFK